MHLVARSAPFWGRQETFGLVETQHGGTVSLTKHGQSVIDDVERPNALAVAFLNVPLHEALYEKYEGSALPPSPAIERHIETLGVPPKQKERARTYIHEVSSLLLGSSIRRTSAS